MSPVSTNVVPSGSRSDTAGRFSAIDRRNISAITSSPLAARTFSVARASTSGSIIKHLPFSNEFAFRRERVVQYQAARADRPGVRAERRTGDVHAVDGADGEAAVQSGADTVGEQRGELFE